MSTNPDFIVTVAVPTWNRGETALRLVETLLPNLPAACAISVLDNASERGLQDYHRIRSIAELDRRVQYIRHDANLQFIGNIVAALQTVQTRWIMFCSDEDYPNAEFLRMLVSRDKNHADVGMIRGSIDTSSDTNPANAMQLADRRYPKGFAALSQTGFHFNYLSGAVYNLDVLHRSDALAFFEKNVIQHIAYPHLYLDTLTAAVADVQTYSAVACTEGTTAWSPSKERPDVYGLPYSYGSRLDSFFHTWTGIMDAESLVKGALSPRDLAILYIHVCHKYLRLVLIVNSADYVRRGLDRTSLAISAVAFMRAAMPRTVPGFADYAGVIEPSLEKMAAAMLSNQN